MLLVDLNPRFFSHGGEGVSDEAGNPIPKRKGIGVSFDCPCLSPSCIRVAIPFDKPLDGGPSPHPEPNTWKRTGDTFETLTLKPSIKRLDNCKWHGWVTNGEVKSV